MKLASETKYNFTGMEMTRISQEIAKHFTAVAQPLANSLSGIKATVFIELEEA